MSSERLSHVIESQQFDRAWLEGELFPLVDQMEQIVNVDEGCDLCKGKRMVSFFYVESTRTRASFEIAMDMLGGRVVFSTDNATEFSSVKKGETIEDTFAVLSRYRPHVIVSRFLQEGDAARAAAASSVPVINAGDGSGQHPTQALLDLYTIHRKLGRIDGITIAMVGDLVNGRTVRSLSYLLTKFRGIRIIYVSPAVACMKDDVKRYLIDTGVVFTEEGDVRNVADRVDVIYQTRVQKERGTDASEETWNAGFKIDREVTGLMKKDAIIMHPLPRVDEIDPAVDADPRAVYLTDQVDAGLYTRMGLLHHLLLQD